MSEGKVAIGIDLGTTYSCVGIYRNNAVEIIANDQGNRTTPSYVAFADEDILVGDAAKNQAVSNPQNTIFDAKRLIGRLFDDPIVQNDRKHWPFKVVEGVGKKPMIAVTYKGQEKTFSPEEISAMVLVKMKEIAETYLGEKVVDAVITCPAYFNDAQRMATKNAGAIAGLNVLRIINEPTAAAIAYGMGNKDEEDEKLVLIFDLGGGTFDVSLLNIAAGVFEVRATAGDTHLGGEDFDARIMQYVVEQFKRKHKGMDPTKNEKALRRLRTECEKGKRALSSVTEVSIDIEAFCEGIDFSCTLTRAKFEDLCMDYFKNCIEPVNQVLRDCKLTKQRVDEVVLVGGSTRIPKVQEMIKELFHGKDPNKSINPDEAVAYGAAVQAAILMGDTSEGTQDLVLLDVAPLSLGVETAGGNMSVLIKRNSTIPAKATKTFSTNADRQTEVEVVVYEGERPLTKDNNLLGKFELTGLPPMPEGVPRIEVSFELDANGILNVSAIEKTTKKAAKIQITNSVRLSAEEVERMVREAEEFKDKDKKVVEKQKARLELEHTMQQIREQISDPSLRIGLQDYETIDKALTWLSCWIHGHALLNDLGPDEYKKQHQMLEEMVEPVLIKLYKGHGLAAKNAGLEVKRKQQMQGLLEEAKRQKFLTQQKMIEHQNKS